MKTFSLTESYTVRDCYRIKPYNFAQIVWSVIRWRGRVTTKALGLM